MVGSIDKLFDRLNRNVANNEQLLESPAQKKYDEGLMKTVTYLRGQVKAGDIGAILADERLILSHTLEFSANSPQEKNSLKSAIAQLDEASKCFEKLRDNQIGYQENVVDTYPTKKREAGLPLDAARDFFKSHSTRLDNLLSSKAAHYEKLLVTQRKDNLRVIRDAYVELQRKALGMDASKKDKALSR